MALLQLAACALHKVPSALDPELGAGQTVPGGLPEARGTWLRAATATPQAAFRD